MNTDQTCQQLTQLKLQGMATRYVAITEQPVHQQPEAHAMVAMLVQAEHEQRILHRTQLYLKLAKLRYTAYVEQVSCKPERGITSEQLIRLSDCAFIQKGENVLITGATGCGKSYLACALGRQACIKGYKVLYYPMNRFIEQLALTRLDGTYIKWLNQIAKAPLLILDDFGLQPLSHDTKMALLQILEDRYASGSTIITAQMPVGNWHEYINDPSLADAICDRLTANAHRINLQGSSLRKTKTN
jgi:DNA replication protein DnaC